MSNDDRRKLSWRERDARNNRSKHRRIERSGTDAYGSGRSNKSYKAELDRFFDSGVASGRIQGLMKEAESTIPEVQVDSPEKTKLVRAVRSSETFNDFVNSVNALRESHSLPADADILCRVLEHPDEDAIQEALRQLTEMASRLAIGDMKKIASRLDTLENVSNDDQTLDLVDVLRARI